jgi:hypothetical protein
MSSSFSGCEAWLSFPKVKWNAEGRLKRSVDPGLWLSGMPGSKDILRPPAGSLGEPEMYSH